MAGAGKRRFWLMKTEPDVFSFEDLVSAPDRTDCWDGVRNYQARNFMRDDMKLGDGILVYHSRTSEPGIYGLAEIVREGYPDETALDPNGKYFDPKSAQTGESRWVMVDVRATHRFQNPVLLAACREVKGLESMALLQKGQRLSVQPVDPDEWKIINKLGNPKKL